MKKSFVRIYGAAVIAAAVSFMCGAGVFALAPQPTDDVFTLTGEGNSNVKKVTVESTLVTEGHVVDPGEGWKDIDDEFFSKAYPYISYGTASWTNLYPKNYVKVEFDMPTDNIAAGDYIYASFYYKAASSLTNAAGDKISSDVMPAQIRWGTSDNTTGAALMVYLIDQSKNTGSVSMVGDDKWHKIDLYVNQSNVTANTLYIHFYNPSAAGHVLIADARAGVLHFSDASKTNNDRAYTEIGWGLQDKTEASRLTVNGQTLDVTGGETEFTVKTGSIEFPSVTAASETGVLGSYVRKLAEDKYSVTVAAGGYDRTLEDSAVVRFRGRGNGTVFNSGGMWYEEAANGTLRGKTYIINLEYDEGFYVNGVKAEEGSVPAGTVYSYRKSFSRPESGNITALFAAYDRNTNMLVDVCIENYAFSENETVKHVKVDMNKENTDDSLYFKVFMLENLENIKPLMESKTTASIAAE